MFFFYFLTLSGYYHVYVDINKDTGKGYLTVGAHQIWWAPATAVPYKDDNLLPSEFPWQRYNAITS